MDNKIIEDNIIKLNLPSRFENKLRRDLLVIEKSQIPGITEVRIFGSGATGKLRASSDLDLLILTEKPVKERVLRAEISEQLDMEWDGVSTDCVFYTMESFQTGQDTFSKELRRDSIIVWKVRE